MHQQRLVKVAVVGPESTGKSTIAEQLAAHYGTLCVPEYAREYCKDLNRQYTLQDELNIYHGQVALEKEFAAGVNRPILICDTMPLTVKIWCDHLFGGTPEFVNEGIRGMHYDLFLLMDIDLPWEDDALRDFPDLRQHFMQIWHQELRAVGARYQLISGLGQSRFDSALKATSALQNELKF